MFRLRLDAPADLADVVCGLLYQAGLPTVLVQEPGDLGTEDDPVAPNHARVLVYASAREPLSLAADLLRVRLRRPPAIEPFEDQDWLHTFRAHHRAVRVGRRLVVAPPWSRVQPRPGRILLRIDPGLAFGTGSHASTHLCLRVVLDLSRRGPLGKVLDVGTGSGILSFAALRLGASSVRAVEPDPEALAAARENARLNRIRRGLTLTAQSAAQVGGRFDLVLANLVRDLLCREAGHLAQRLRPTGRLVVAGILDDQAPEVARAFAAAGLDVERHLCRHGWSALLLRGHSPSSNQLI